ncbi:hypothetical protein INT47_005565 [Mucor saturninus]|uniref:ATP-dependent DNA helicase n=1 Tax=Mucor saturninus TaxID=64648 RepID=A0A8H7VAD7_9FUNG|nr:hypothetical protein INT47_005565 [Mucor saturninus]
MSNNSRNCASCGQQGHSRRTHRDCPLNRANQNENQVPLSGIESEGREQNSDRCSTCLQLGHSRRSSALCPMNNTRSTSTLNQAKQTDTLLDRHNLGGMSTVCSYCHAYMWVQERSDSGVNTAQFQLCCGSGKYRVTPLQSTPGLISNLLRNNDQRSKEFKINIRAYNNALSFASMGVNLDESVQNSRGGAYAFRIHGSIYHRIESLLPADNAAPSFAQICVYDAENEINNRHRVASHVDINTLGELQFLMHDIYPIVRDFKTMNQYLIENPNHVADVSMVFRAEGLPDPRRYNSPTTSTEVGILILGSGSRQDGDEIRVRDIIIRPQSQGQLKRINELNQTFDPMSYALIFPTGQPGRHTLCTSDSGLKVTPMQFYSFHFMFRNCGHDLHLFGKRFHQFIVDMYAKIEQFRLNYIRHNQSNLRTELYRGLQDAVAHDDNDTTSLGRKIILPSSFIGGPRHMSQLYQDAISIVRRFGKPDYFITFTCNPAWPEIQNELLYGQAAADRPDLCSRVFHLKFKSLMKDITKDHILGVVVGYVAVVEFQKRGLPHAHMLFIVKPEHKPRTTTDFDKIISAEIPNQESFPMAYATVTKNMMHGPCGSLNPRAICMKDGKCSKGYPKKFVPITTTAESGYPIYRRRRDGRSVTKANGVALDNIWVVPHNIFLCTKASVQISSNDQQANANTVSHDEINHFIDARYVSAPEASWRIFGFSLHKEFPSHQRLSIHLPGQETVYFAEGANLSDVLANSASKNTTLTAWFNINRTDLNANQYLYHEFPEYYTWQKKETVWRTRQRGFNQTIGRIYSVSPKESEKYYLRLLLNYVRGAKSFEDMRTVEGVLYETYQAAARAKGLLADDEQWDTCLLESDTFQSTFMLRQLFVIILVFCNPSSPFQLWMTHKDNLAYGYLLTQKRLLTDDNSILTDEMKEEAYGNCLWDLNEMLDAYNINLDDFAGFILPSIDTRNTGRNFGFDGMSRLEREQRELCIMELVNGEKGVRRTNCIALSVAVSGTASLLLKGGRTAHSRFGIPLLCDQASMCFLKPRSNNAALIALSSLIVWDEASMISRDVLETVDRSFRDIMRHQDERLGRVPFGGKLIVFIGDFRQVLPVVPKGTKDDIIQACMITSHLFKHIKQLRLTINMRVQQAQLVDSVESAQELEEFSSFLLRIGKGQHPVSKYFKTICLPSEMVLPGNSISNLCRHVYNDFENEADVDSSILMSKAILAPTNAFVSDVNDHVLEKFPGEYTTFFSTDTALSDNDALTLPPEFMNSLECGSLPPHQLKLKIGSPIMMLRNLAPAQGVCNGTRLICKALLLHTIQAEVATGPYEGNIFLIPRISLCSTVEQVGVEFKRCQFPIRPAFAMTINKSQGQTLDSVGLYLPTPVFSHGQLYVALSRVKRPSDIKILIPAEISAIEGEPGTYASNVVYKEIFRS